MDVNDHSPNHHHCDLLYGNHLSTEQTPPAHHRGIFQRLLKAKSNISSGAGGEKCHHLHCLSGLVSAQKHERMLIVLGSKWTWTAILRKHHYQPDNGGLLSMKVS